MKNKQTVELLSITFLGLVIVFLGSILPKDDNLNSRSVVIGLGILILLIAVYSFFTKK